jgi:carboxyl-terminal processing protease
MTMRFARNVVVAAVLLCGVWPLSAQSFDSNQKSRAKQMLGAIKLAIQNRYYDPAYHGVDLNAKFKEADQKLDGATSQAFAYAVIAQTLLDFNDSHLYFIPPERPSKYEYGWSFGMVGDQCLVLAVKPGSDAEQQGLKAGDQILRIENFGPNRDNLWKIQYLYYALSPRAALRVSAQSPGAQPRDLTIKAAVTKKPAVKEISLEFLEQFFDDEARETMGDATRSSRVGDVGVWKFESFVIDPGTIDKLMDTVTKGATSLVIDLRGNGGGYIATLQRVVSKLFDSNVTIATVKGRKSSKPMAATARKPVFSGKLVVIIDSQSASSSELLARTVQLEGRGKVVGDQSAGAVMQAEGFQDVMEGLEGLIPYGASITNADLIMKDGKSLERTGVTPDERVLITGEDLAAGRDPVLARAIALAGGSIDPPAAGKLFPVRWKKQ